MSRFLRVAALCSPLPKEKVQITAGVEVMQKFWDEKLKSVWADNPEFIVLPECCDRFIAHTPQERMDYYAFRGDKLLNFFAEQAAAHNCMITYPAVFLEDDGIWRNMVFVINRNGEVISKYYKNYPMETEINDYHIKAGETAPVASCEWGKLASAICFDLNFDKLFQQYAKEKVDILSFHSVFHGGLLQKMRAYQCHCHLVTAIAGERCTVLDPQGELIASSTNYQYYLSTTLNLDCATVHYDDGNFDKLAQLKLKYGNNVLIRDPGYLGSVLVTSMHSEVSVHDMLKEFEMMEVADYLKRAELCADKSGGRL
ncbi:MAG: carbon-nitrogen hydrolase family protein [Lentisphaeria bacterium]|nr:carbon-nitrogen hydrolase family protein [Lentisphaeria bacterium]